MCRNFYVELLRWPSRSADFFVVGNSMPHALRAFRYRDFFACLRPGFVHVLSDFCVAPVFFALRGPRMLPVLVATTIGDPAVLSYGTSEIRSSTGEALERPSLMEPGLIYHFYTGMSFP